MTLELRWAWELRPSQLFQKNRFVKSSGTKKLFQEVRPFACPRLPLPGTSFTYQLALSRVGKTEEVQALYLSHRDLPDSGDYRCGVIFFDGEEIIASLIVSGVNAKQPFKMVVHPDYRDQDLAERLLVEWWSHVKHTYRESGDQAMTVVAVKVLLKAHKAVRDRMVSDPAMASTVNSITDEAYEAEAAQVLAEAQAVEDGSK